MGSSASASLSVRPETRGVARAVGFVVFIAAALLAGPVQAQQVRLGGFVQLDRRLALGGDSVRLADFYNVFRPELSASFGGRVDLVVSLDFRFYDFTAARSTDDLKDADLHFPSSFTVWEAQARISGFLFDPLDLTIGKQRVRWGTADGLNPTDRFSPYDLSDLTDFTARIPTWAVRAECYVTDEWRVEGVWTPTAHGPLLPPGADGALGKAGGRMPSGSVPSWEEHFEAPSRRLSNSQYGLKAAGHAAGLDVSLSYFDGFDGIPAAERVLLVGKDGASASQTFDGHAWTALPRIRVLGGDVATEWRGIGLWGEGAVVFPERMELVTDVVASGDSVRDRVVAPDRRPYATWTLGGDYTFPGGWYLNVQWAHGLFLERGADELHDYLLGKLEQRLFRETVTLTLKGALEVAQWSAPSDHLGIGVFPEVVYAPVDNVDVSLGAFLAGGGGTTLFGRWDDADQVYLRVKASF
jgi:hypothetical protein